MFRPGVAFAVLVVGLSACESTPQSDLPDDDDTATTALADDRPVPPPPPPPPDPEDDSVVLTQDGIGDLRLDRDVLSLGVSEVEEWLGTDLFMAGQTEFCSLAIDEDLGIAVVMDDYSAVLGFVIDNPQVATPEGISVGSPAEELEAAYGEAVAVLPGVVSQTGGPLAFVDDEDHPGASPGPGTLHFAFDTDEGGTVTRLRSGFWPWVGYTDYCSPEADHPEYTGWPLVGK